MHCPTVTVSGLTPSSFDGEGNYVAGDYDTAYYNNTDIGIASVVLTGNLEKGYYGTKVVTFKTLAKPFNTKDYSVMVKGSFDGKTYTATTDEEYSHSFNRLINYIWKRCKVISNEGSDDVRLTEGVDYTVSYKNNNKVGTATVSIAGKNLLKGSLKDAGSFEIIAKNLRI